MGFPIGSEYYTLYENVGEGVSASVYRALCIPKNEIVAIKILDFEQSNSDLKNISREAQMMFMADHPNVLKSHCSFVSDQTLWVVMPYMAGGSCLHILKFDKPGGMEEVVIATILREVLKGIEYLHDHGHIHRDVKAGNILISSGGSIKLGDLGVSACLFDSGDRQRTRNTFVGTPCWMAPEVMEQSHGYDFKADIWSFGITALELAHGHAPFSKYPPMKVLLMTLQNAPPSLDYVRDKKFSKSFKHMIAGCLVKDPAKRPSAKKLIKHPFFKQAKSNDYIARKLLDGLEPLGDRIKSLKKNEEDMLAQKKMPYGEKEERSQSEYKRGISSWTFNLEDVKAEASLIQDDDILENGSVGDCSVDNHSQVLDYICEENDVSNYHSSSGLPISDSTSKSLKNKFEKSDDESSIGSSKSSNNDKSVSQCCSPNQIEYGDNNMGVTSNIEGLGKMIENCSLPLHSRRASSPASVYTLEVPTTRVESFKSPRQHESVLANEITISSQGIDELTIDQTSRNLISSPAPNINDELETRVSVIQRKGRFQVTSENIDNEKAITPSSTISLSSPNNEKSMNLPTNCLFSLTQSMLQANVIQTENLLCMMKYISSNSVNVNSISEGGGCSSTSIAAIEKSLLEASHEKEKELLQEISMLQLRIIRIEEELQKLKAENTHNGDC